MISSGALSVKTNEVLETSFVFYFRLSIPTKKHKKSSCRFKGKICHMAQNLSCQGLKGPKCSWSLYFPKILRQPQ